MQSLVDDLTQADFAHRSSDRVVARVQAQAVRGGRLVDDGAAVEVDVTDVVHARRAGELQQVRDNDVSSDRLVPFERHWCPGLYRVEVEGALRRHFSVAALSHITPAILSEAVAARVARPHDDEALLATAGEANGTTFAPTRRRASP